MSATAVKTLQPDETFREFFLGALTEARQKRDAERVTGKRTYFYVSEVGDVIGDAACPRKTWYAWNNAPKDPMPAETLMAFEIGDVVGLRVANIIAGTGKVEKVELKIDFPGHPVSGRLDVLAVPSLKRVIEVKTTPHRATAYLPKEEHIRQTNLYVHRIRAMEGFEDYDGTLAYFVKDAAKGQPVILPYRIPYDEKLAVESLEAFHDALWVAEGESRPKRPEGFTQTKFPCGYCSFKTHCWSALDIKEEPDPFVTF